MKKFNLYLTAFVALSFLLIGCEKDDHSHDDEELITTLIYSLTSETDGSVIAMSFRDPDGDGGVAPTIIGGTLKANHSYKGSITLLNESVNPVEDITEEVRIEAVNHQFFFSSTVSGLTVTYDDQDKDGRPLGIKTVIKTGAAGNGSFKIILRHNPNKSASGVRDGNIANAGGETDIEVNFPITVQ